MAQMQGGFDTPAACFAGKQQVAGKDVGALAEKLDAIGVDDGSEPAVMQGRFGIPAAFFAGKQQVDGKDVGALAEKLNAIGIDDGGEPAVMQGRFGIPAAFFTGKQQVASKDVGALAEKLDAIGVDDGGEPAVNHTTVLYEEVVVAPRRTIKVKTLAGRVIDVDVEPTDTVGRIKERVEELEGIPPEQQRLIFEGKLLADGKTVLESKVTPGCVIHLVLALRGGGGRCNK